MITTEATKTEKYELLLHQIASLIENENDEIAVLANICAAIRQTFRFFWVGFYRTTPENILILGPFQGDVACYRIEKNKGVCGTAWQKASSIIVPNVHEFDGHIACSPASKSEIVVPVFDKNNAVRLILDIDSDEFNHFDSIDQKYLEKLAELIKNHLY